MLSTVLGTETTNTKQDIGPDLQLTDIIVPLHEKNLNAMIEEALVLLEIPGNAHMLQRSVLEVTCPASSLALDHCSTALPACSSSPYPT